MNRIFLRVAAAAASLVLAGAAFADPVLLLNAASYPPAQVLPAPASDGSAEQKLEMDELHRIQKHMTADDFAKADRDDKTEDASIFIEVLGPAFDLKALPKTAALFKTVRAEEKAAAKIAKTTFARNRPWVLDAKLKTCTRDDPPPSSYPSGHATMGYSFAVVLAAMVPEKAPAILARAKVYAENRLVCGDHYRSDIVAGEVLGTVVAEELLATPAFQKDFAVAKEELTAALAQSK